MSLFFVFKINTYIYIRVIKFVRLFLSQSLVTRSFFLPLPNSFCIRISDLLSSLFHDRSPVPYHKNENFRIATRTANGVRSFKTLTENRFPKTRGCTDMHVVAITRSLVTKETYRGREIKNRHRNL